MAEVVASMTATISTDWSNWMKELDDSEQWRELLREFCNKRCIEVVDNGNVIRLSGNFEAIKDVRGFLQGAAKHASEKREKEEKKRIKLYERNTSISPTTGLEEKCEQMKIAGPEVTEKREDAKPKRVRILKVTTALTEGEKPDDVTRSDDVGSGTRYHHDSSTNLTKMLVNQNQSTESQVLDDKLISSDEMMTTKIEQPRNYFDSELNDEMTPDILKRQMPQIHKIAYQGQMQESIYPPLSPDKFSADARQMVPPIYTLSDQGRTEQCSNPSQVQPAGHQGQLRQHNYTSQTQRQLVGNQAQMNHLGYPSQGYEQATYHKGQMEKQINASHCQGQATGHQGPTGNYSCPSQDQGQATGFQGQTAQQSYSSHGQGQVTHHQAHVQQPSYSSQGPVTYHQGILQPIVNHINPGQRQIFHPSPVPHFYKQFTIKHAGNSSLYFTSNRAYNVLNISVHMRNIVDQPTQVLVSSANCQLTTHGSVSKAILNAAGQSVVDECSQIIATCGFPAFGAVIPTKAGNLGPHVHTILHAIIPTPQEFQNDPQGSFSLLIRVFHYALCMSSGQTKSVSFPAIGSEIFGLQRMAEAFICGLRAFDQGVSSWPAIFIPGEIHLISNDLNKLKTIVDTLYYIVNIV